MPGLSVPQAGVRCGLLAAAIVLAAPVGAQQFRYDARIAWVEAGELDLSLLRQGDRYELSGTVTTSKTMQRFFNWRGRFAATGRFDDGFPRTRAYLLIEEDGTEREVLLAAFDRTRIHATGRESRELDQPPGSDLMSVAFLAAHCLDEAQVHDGEDVYRLTLERSGRRQLRQKKPYYSGSSMRCDYRFRYDDGSTRRVSIWTATLDGRNVVVRLRFRVPLLPDGILRLRL